MKTRFIAVLLTTLLPAGVLLAAPAPSKSGEKKAPAKSPADLAYDEFNKVFREPGGKIDQARFQKVIAPGLAFLSQFPTHNNAHTVIRELPRWGGLRDRDPAKEKALQPQRIAFLSLLKYELLTARYKEGLSNDAKAALAALDASTVDAETREVFNNSNLNALREKLDALAAMPGSGRYLVDRERSYIEILTLGVSPARAEQHLQTLVKHSDKGVQSMARQELNIIELKQKPYDVKLATLDGKGFDFSQQRGKVVAMYVWNTGTRDIVKNMDGLKQIHSMYRKKGFEVVTVSLDKAEDRPKLEKFIKDNRISFPVYFDGQGAKADFLAKMNITSAPRLVIFDKAGILQSNNLQLGQLEPAVKKLQEPPPKKK